VEKSEDSNFRKPKGWFEKRNLCVDTQKEHLKAWGPWEAVGGTVKRKKKVLLRTKNTQIERRGNETAFDQATKGR